VTGPTAPNKNWNELHDRAYFDISFSSVSGIGSIVELTIGPKDRLYERFIREISEDLVLTKLYPRTMIKITMQVLSDDGSLLSTALNALILALLDSSISLKSTISAATCIVHENGSILVDPTNLELKNAKSVHNFALNAIDGGLTSAYSVGVYSDEDV
jgi:exosome complex component RRP46